jgi:hypothetical protein
MRWNNIRPIVTIDDGTGYFLQGEATELEVREVADTMVPSIFGKSIVLEPRAFVIHGKFVKLNHCKKHEPATLTTIYRTGPEWLWKFIRGQIL